MLGSGRNIILIVQRVRMNYIFMGLIIIGSSLYPSDQKQPSLSHSNSMRNRQHAQATSCHKCWSACCCVRTIRAQANIGKVTHLGSVANATSQDLQGGDWNSKVSHGAVLKGSALRSAARCSLNHPYISCLLTTCAKCMICVTCNCCDCCCPAPARKESYVAPVDQTMEEEAPKTTRDKERQRRRETRRYFGATELVSVSARHHTIPDASPSLLNGHLNGHDRKPSASLVLESVSAAGAHLNGPSTTPTLAVPAQQSESIPSGRQSSSTHVPAVALAAQ